MKWSLVVAGIGGQGVLFVTRILERAALASGWKVFGAETHGMSQRGGSVTSHFRVGPFTSPLVRRGTADCLLGLSVEEGLRNASLPRPGALVVLDAEPGAIESLRARPVLDRLEIAGTDVRTIGAGGIAKALGLPRLANVVLLGSALAHPDFPFEPQLVRAAIDASIPPELAARNREALDRGIAEGLARFLPAKRPTTAAPTLRE